MLEDAATLTTAIAVQNGSIALPLGLFALYAGIVLGDIGLYGLGRLAGSFAWARRLVPAPQAARGRNWLAHHVFRTVFVARFMPGVRLPTYTACGFLRVSLARFALAAIGATLVWTSLLFFVSMRIGVLLMNHLGAWRWAGVVGFVMAATIAARLAARAAAARE